MLKSTTLTSMISFSTAHYAIGASIVTLLLLASLHILSPEFDPAWRMVSEYANGGYGWVLSLMFFAWAISAWTVAYAIRGYIKTTGGKIGLVFLIVAGIGEAMGGLFDTNHPWHGLSAAIGIPSFAIAAMLISVSLSRTEPWSAERKTLLLTANLTWVSILIMAISFIIMIITFTQAGGDMTAEATAVTTLPTGVIAVVGWANRFLVVVYNAWVMTVAWCAANTN